jgi:hypothetical protein
MTLAGELARELKSGQPSGQPRIYEHRFPTDTIRVTVIWDKWEPVPLEERGAVILRAYEQAEGAAYRSKILLATGLTVPEAYAAGYLPYRIVPGLREDDPFTQEQCENALRVEGASLLGDPDSPPVLRLATREEAEQARTRLDHALPGSLPLWIIIREGIEPGAEPFAETPWENA